MLFFSCKEKTILANSAEEVNKFSKEIKIENGFIYNEVKRSKETFDDLGKDLVKLDIEYEALFIKIRVIDERSYINLELESTELINWKPVMISFYNMDISDVVNNTHLLLKDNNFSNGYLLFPSTTEQFFTYNIYSFKKGELNYIGTYEHEEVYNKNNYLSYNEKTKEFYINSHNKSSKLKKINDSELEENQNLKEDLKLINESTKIVHSSDINKWIGQYSLWLNYGNIGGVNTGWELKINIDKNIITASGEGYQIYFLDELTAYVNEDKLIMKHKKNIDGYSLGENMNPEFSLIEDNGKYYIQTEWINDVINKSDKRGYEIIKK